MYKEEKKNTDENKDMDNTENPVQDSKFQVLDWICLNLPVQLNNLIEASLQKQVVVFSIFNQHNSKPESTNLSQESETKFPDS